jgi:hypothetical protein
MNNYTRLRVIAVIIERKKERKYIYWTAHTSKTDTEVTEKTEVNTHKYTESAAQMVPVSACLLLSI